jgi:hypothetical protein
MANLFFNHKKASVPRKNVTYSLSLSLSLSNLTFVRLADITCTLHRNQGYGLQREDIDTLMLRMHLMMCNVLESR